MAEKKTAIAVAEGDGIGPEIMGAALHVLRESGASLDIRKVEIGEKVYLSGEKAGIHPQTWDVLRECSAFLKAPITTPQGGGYKSLNVTVRTTLGLYANVRPCVAYHPFINTKHPNMDVVIVRENEEDLYAGIEYRQTRDVYQALKLISQSGCEKIVRYAFEYAKANGRKKVTCFTKDNILKITDGQFHKVFQEICKEYPEIEHEHWIVDIGAAKLADTPEIFDVVVMPNLYGDILSDVAAQIAGSVGMAGSANIGEHGAMFEAIHGSAPRMTGQNSANPSGLILAAVQMLVHIGQTESAGRIHNAWLKTIEDGIHTYDIFTEGLSKQSMGTREFAKDVAERLGKLPEKLKAVYYIGSPQSLHKPSEHINAQNTIHKELVGVDVFLDHSGTTDQVRDLAQQTAQKGMRLTMLANRGVKVWPGGHPETACTGQWRCRFMAAENGRSITHHSVAALLQGFADKEADFVQTELLYTYDGHPGYTVSQDEQ